MISKNTQQLWDGFWDRKIGIEEDRYLLIKEENSVRFRRMERIISSQFDCNRQLNAIEIGAGSGVYAALLAKRGFKVTVLDYSTQALSRARIFFERNGLQAEFIQANIFQLPNHLLGKYDIVMSFGLTEHFLGEERFLANKVHFELTCPGGVTFVAVPHAVNLGTPHF